MEISLKKYNFKLKKDENNKLLSNTVRNLGTKLRILNLIGNKWHYLYSTMGLYAISPNFYYVPEIYTTYFRFLHIGVENLF